MAEHGHQEHSRYYVIEERREEKYDPTDRLLRFFHYPNKYEEEYKPRFESRCLKFDSEAEEFIVRIEFGHTGSL